MEFFIGGITGTSTFYGNSNTSTNCKFTIYLQLTLILLFQTRLCSLISNRKLNPYYSSGCSSNLITPCMLLWSVKSQLRNWISGEFNLMICARLL